MLYSKIEISKAGEQIPLFNDGTPMHSRYNATREAISFGDEIKTKLGCIVVAGIGGGFHIKRLLEKFPDSIIICFEQDLDSLSFCSLLDINIQLKQQGVIFCTVDTLSDTIIKNYLPSVYDNFYFLEHNVWRNKCLLTKEQIDQIIKGTLQIISADYSVQCHFGKLWYRNILLNTYELSTCKHENNLFQISNPDLSKTAAVIAAGPSLDSSITKLFSNRQDYFIISTDTSYGTLLANKIIPDIVVSIDGQNISTTHFYQENNQEELCNKPIFVFDICASHNAVKLIKSKGFQLFFVQSGHPLSKIVNEYTNLPLINTGAGTVTIAGFDIARILGFCKIEMFGADFSYNSGKPYTKGTYLDKNFINNRKETLEFQFTRLMFRTPLKKINHTQLYEDSLKNPFTSEILEKYGSTLIEYATFHKYKLFGSIFITQNLINKDINKYTQKTFDYSKFINNLINNLTSLCKTKLIIPNKYFYSALPYISWYKMNHCSNSLNDFFPLLKLEKTDTVRYTKLYEQKEL